MPDYQKSKIYKLWSPSKNLIYYGSTTRTLSQRLTDHIHGNRIYKLDNTKKYMSSFEILDCEDYKIELVEEFPCDTRQQLCKREGHYIKNNDCVNERIAGRVSKEHYRDNCEKILERCQKYYNDNHSIIREKYKNYYNTNKEQINEKTREKYKENHSKFREKYNANKERINERRRQRYKDLKNNKM